MSELTKYLVDARLDDLRRDTRRAALQADALAARRQHRVLPNAPITIRHATPDDASALARLAALDSAQIPGGAVLLAESSGELRAALSLSDGTAVADPFHPTGPVIELLTSWATQGQPHRLGRVSRWSRRRRSKRASRDRRGPAKPALV